MSIRSSIVTISVCSLAVASASAQLVVGTTATTGNGSAFYINLNTLTAQTLWNSAANKKVNGLAADIDTGRLYSNDAARLNTWNYGAIGTAPTFIAGMYRTNDNTTFTATGVDGLAFARGSLYGVTQFGSTVYKRGIYQISTTTDGAGHCIMTPLWLDPTGIGTLSGTLGLGGLEYNPGDNLFYFTNSADTTGTGGTYTRGIYTVDAFGSGALTKLIDFPINHTRIDGLAIGNGKIWLTEMDATPANNGINIFSYDLATQAYDGQYFLPLSDLSQRASGACWAPGANLVFPTPGTLAGLAFAAVAATRRRR